MSKENTDITASKSMYRLPETDIDNCINFSITQFVFSIIGFALVLTDIPRTGLGLRSLNEIFGVVAPSTAILYGPYAYPSVHINVTGFEDNRTFVGSEGSTIVENVALWPYKSDTLSIPQRSLAQHMKIEPYPNCLMKDTTCSSKVLSLPTAFTMLDGLVTNLRNHYFQPNMTIKGYQYPPFQFVTRSVWMDRLHHILLKHIWKDTHIRFHSVRFYDSESIEIQDHICNPESLDRNTRPSICDLSIAFLCDHPVYGSNVSVSLPEHIALRVALLRQEYPQLEIDLTIITTTIFSASKVFKEILPSVFYGSEGLELTTIIRGRQCVTESNQKVCETSFVDDYRYERSVTRSDVAEWYPILSTLRCFGQGYVWLRIALLWIGCYKARATEKRYQQASLRIKIYATWTTFFKIPSDVIVYGSWFPILCYSLAHYLDSPLIHMLSDNVWESMNGYVNFKLVTFIKVASIQMRNIWYLALFFKITMALSVYFIQPRKYSWLAYDGLIGIGGAMIGTISGLTVFSSYRSRSYRDVSILSFLVLEPYREFNKMRSPMNIHLEKFGFRFDMKVLFIAGVIVGATAIVIRFLLAKTVLKSCNSIFWSHSSNLPLSTGKLWPMTALIVYWEFGLQRKQYITTHPPQDKVKPSLMNVMISSSFQLARWNHGSFKTHHVKQQAAHNQQFLRDLEQNDDFPDITKRSKYQWSVVRLMNIAMMTDPFVLVDLYLRGQQLFIYELKTEENSSHKTLNGSQPHIEYILPYTMKDLERSITELSIESGSHLELVESVDSSSLAWSRLVNCG